MIPSESRPWIERALERVNALADSHGSLLAFAVIAVGAILRLQGLDRQSLWMDELFSVQASRSLESIWAFYQWDLHPPLYSLLLWGWTSVVGNSETAVRLLSALCGIATLGVTWFVGRKILGAPVALAFLGLMAFSQRAIYFSQEARSYALLILLCTTLVILWLPMMVRKDALSQSDAIAFSALSILTGWTHYYGTIFVFSLWGLLVGFRLLRPLSVANLRWFLGGAAVFLSCIGEYFFHNRFIGQSELPFHAEMASLWRDLPLFFFGTPFAIGAFFVLAVGLALWRWRRPHGADDATHLRSIGWLLALCASVTLAALLLNVFRNSFSARNILVLLPVVLGISAIGLAGLSGRFRSTWAALACVAACSQFLASAPWYWRGQGKQQWREAAVVASNEATDRSLVATVANFDFQRSAIPAYDIEGDAWGYYLQRSPTLKRLNEESRIFQIASAELPLLVRESETLNADKLIVVRAHSSETAAVSAEIEALGRPFRHVPLVKSDVWIVSLK
ncbi:MAG: glycosyltransferase family 39 protein [Terrimicrobiaceae bacterium]